jgi:AbrB family looped-hinge helix DNA binding protein
MAMTLFLTRGSFMERHAVKIGPGGRIVIPAQLREKLGVKPGDTIWLEEDNEQVRISSVRQAIRHVQELVRQYVPEGVSLVDELIAERRAEAQRE